MKAKETEKKDNLKANAGNIDRMFAVGAHFGYSKSRRHPSIKPYIFGAKNWVEIIDLEKTDDLLKGATEFAKKLGAEGKKILFVGSKDEAKQAIEEGAGALDMPYVTGRWIGGTITNFSEIKKRLNKMEDLSSKKDKGELAQKYTKKEQVMLDREMDNLKTNFLGIGLMTEIPHTLFVVDTKKEMTSVKEARQKRIPVIGLLNSDSNLSEIDYPIVANDATRASIKFFVDEIVKAYKEGVKEGLKSKE
ncbi:MAG: 30S ribosomal protein S2 [Candidatus Pacebacteria bacterium]|jgi:small subunit ribosomal protein S2|nr:30S ribosomal protein S2 [Parcubacteria group bacterium]MDP6249633.1 30S ribosomal protein S2 [Candidatus Paceibacterota bacterium]MDP7159381.1 30S ribosomal protein S2 [Candidatus Paceibacterota bacterium]MDP7366191.1 30S ribosomal protein S2 [Candidatus Paceibacterota bacterium]MDP7466272.1 30S ribosomal protein S2 [Candidatus Paceibacterota bacterium]|tara:strand:- start:6786 stop:7529 length:744 start_codon:yes stop_codon:yes gene_type:complete